MASKKKKKKASGKRGKSPRMLLRSVIDDVEHGQCGSAVTTLVEAAKKTPSRGKMKKHLDAVTSAVVRGCLRGGGGFNVPPQMRTTRKGQVSPSGNRVRFAPRPNAFDKLYKHAGPKGRIPGARPPQHGGSMPVRQSDAGWYGAHSHSHVPAPGHSYHTQPSFDGLGRLRRRRGR